MNTSLYRDKAQRYLERAKLKLAAAQGAFESSDYKRCFNEVFSVVYALCYAYQLSVGLNDRGGYAIFNRVRQDLIRTCRLDAEYSAVLTDTMNYHNHRINTENLIDIEVEADYQIAQAFAFYSAILPLILQQL